MGKGLEKEEGQLGLLFRKYQKNGRAASRAKRKISQESGNIWGEAQKVQRPEFRRQGRRRLQKGDQKGGGSCGGKKHRLVKFTTSNKVREGMEGVQRVRVHRRNKGKGGYKKYGDKEMISITDLLARFGKRQWQLESGRQVAKPGPGCR